MICKVCKRYFRLKKEDKYDVEKVKSIMGRMALENQQVYECFDCPKCGCQNIVNIREK